MKTKLTTLLVLLIAAVFASACGGGPANASPATSILTQAEATAIGENALTALNSGDYAAWSRDWDDSMKSAVNEDAFLAFREQVIQQVGQYQSILAVEMTPSKNADSVRWVYTCQFEKAKVRLIMAFPQDGRLANTVITEPVE
jgi:hypothetical protein